LRRSLGALAVVLVLVFPACAPRRTARPSSSRVGAYPPQVATAPAPAPSPEGRIERPEASRVILEERSIREEDLKGMGSSSPEVREQAMRPAPAPRALPLPDDSSLLAKITPQTSPQAAASLRLTEEGRKLLAAGQYKKALTRLEKTIAIDSTNPYGYYYLAQAHYRLDHYQESLNFLDVAEGLVGSDPYWLAEVFALKGENFHAMGFLQRADSSYSQALQLNPRNRVASEGQNRLRGEVPPALP